MIDDCRVSPSLQCGGISVCVGVVLLCVCVVGACPIVVCQIGGVIRVRPRRQHGRAHHMR